MKWLDSLRKQGGSSLNDEGLAGDNESTDNRNGLIFGCILIVALLLWVAFYILTRPANIQQTPIKAPEFGTVITPDFGIKDTQSALQLQQLEVASLKRELELVNRRNNTLESKLDDTVSKITDALRRNQTRSETRLSNVLNEVEAEMQDKIEELEQRAVDLMALVNANTNRNPFGDATSNGTNGAQTTNKGNTLTGGMQLPSVIAPIGIQTFSYRYENTETTAPYRRTSENYVPTGSFVTAVLTGAADANAGVNAQGDTAPITFRTIHNGILPNGKQSRLKGCFITASVYGEISSNRGIARLNNLSCIFNDEEKGEEILDIPVQGTAFNFGRNGIRGTPVMRNGKIIQMAGIAGLFTGLGDTATNASSTQISGPAGIVSSVNPSQALLNMGGSALENVGSKMADYYIKLAEQYHPIIELRPGAVVNLVFLKGFPLDADKLAEYEAKLYGESTQGVQTLMSTYLNPLTGVSNMINIPQGTLPVSSTALRPSTPTQTINPLLDQLPPSLKPLATQQYNAQQQVNPF